MADAPQTTRYRFGVFDLDVVTGELRRKGMRVKLHAQPFLVLRLLVRRPGEMLTREEICRELWPDGTFVDYDHGVNSAVNRLREALGDTAKSPRFVETIARRGYRFVAPVEEVGAAMEEPVLTAPVAPEPVAEPSETRVRAGLLDRVLAAPEDLPQSSPAIVRTLFVLLQGMYLGFYVGALANLGEIGELLSPLAHGSHLAEGVMMMAALLIPVRVFLICAVLFRAPGLHANFLRIWPFLLGVDVLWALAPFLLLHHLVFGLALACSTVLVYAPFAQRSLVLMGAADSGSMG